MMKLHYFSNGNPYYKYRLDGSLYMLSLEDFYNYISDIKHSIEQLEDRLSELNIDLTFTFSPNSATSFNLRLTARSYPPKYASNFIEMESFIFNDFSLLNIKSTIDHIISNFYILYLPAS